MSAGIWIPHLAVPEGIWSRSFKYMTLLSGSPGTTRVPLWMQIPMHGMPTRLEYARIFELRSRALNGLLAPL
jgi:hypothetical protein